MRYFSECVLYYCEWTDSHWQSIEIVTRSLVEIRNPSIKVVGNNELKVMWTGYGGEKGAIYYSSNKGGAWSSPKYLGNLTQNEWHNTFLFDENDQPLNFWIPIDDASSDVGIFDDEGIPLYYYLDFEKPVISITSPSNNTLVNDVILIEGISTDDRKIITVGYRLSSEENWHTIGGTTYWSLNWDSTKVQDGEHTLIFRAYDGVQYSSEVYLTLMVENQHEKDDEVLITIPLNYLVIIILIGFGSSITFLEISRMKKSRR